MQILLEQVKPLQCLTSALMGRWRLPSLPRRCSGDSMAPRLHRSAYLSWSVSVVAEMPASGPRLGREPAVTEGSGICPGIMSHTPLTTAGGETMRGVGLSSFLLKYHLYGNKTCCSKQTEQSSRQGLGHLCVYRWCRMKEPHSLYLCISELDDVFNGDASVIHVT